MSAIVAFMNDIAMGCSTISDRFFRVGSIQSWVGTVRGVGNRKSKVFSEIVRKKTPEIGIPTHLCHDFSFIDWAVVWMVAPCVFFTFFCGRNLRIFGYGTKYTFLGR
ncbi:unnamed protein product [Meloidogyne enterolobii]|uniref:Uncharacterized protein n=1 Tax=Meloidogyne enterolobii TaxID=390850 RepID=A0ACB0Y672_MELEN